MAKLSQFSVDFSKALSPRPDTSQSSQNPLLVCTLCDRLHTQPRILSCLHTFCHKCLQYEALKQGGEGKGTIVCPLCLQQTSMSGGISSLPENHVVTKMLEAEAIMSGNIHCTNCETAGAIAAARCNDCPEFLCAHCISIHNFVKVFKSHKVIPISELSQQDLTAFSQPLSCQIHKGALLELFCDTCEVLICKKCTQEGHEGSTHEHSRVKDVWAGKQPELNTALKAGKEKHSNMHTRAKELEGEIKSLEQKEEEVQEKVTDAFGKLKELVEKREGEVLRELERMGKEKKSTLYKAHMDIKQGMAKLQGFCQFTEMLTSQASPAHGLTLHNLVASQYHNLVDSIDVRSFDNMPAELKLNLNQDEITEALSKIAIVDAHKPTEMPTVPQHWWNGSNNLEVNSTEDNDDRRHSWSGVVKAGLAHNNTTQASPTPASPSLLNNLDTDSGASSGDDNGDSPAQMAGGAHNDKIQTEKQLQQSAAKSKFLGKVEALHKFGTPGSIPGQFLFPHSVAAGKNGLLYISDGQNHRIQVFDRQGKFQFKFGKKGRGWGMFIQPTYLAMSPEGHLYVRDKGSKRVQEFSDKGHFIDQFFLDDLHEARGMVCDKRGRILIVDKGNDRHNQGVAFYSPSGALLKRISCPNIPKMTVYANPVASGPTGEIFVCDHLGHCLQVYDTQGRNTRRVGNNTNIDVLMGVLTDSDDNLVVMNGITTVTGHNCIDQMVRFRQDGTLVDKIKLFPSKQSINNMNLLEGRYPVGISNSKNWCLLYDHM